MPELQLPYRLSEKSFRNYEDYIAKAVEVHPNTLVIPLQAVTLITFQARLRDAMASYEKYDWGSYIPRQKFLELRISKFLQVGYLIRDDITFATIGNSGVEIDYITDSFVPKLSDILITLHEPAILRSILILKVHEQLQLSVRFVDPPNVSELCGHIEDAGLVYDMKGNDVIIL